jgi:hypothetical protein
MPIPLYRQFGEHVSHLRPGKATRESNPTSCQPATSAVRHVLGRERGRMHVPCRVTCAEREKREFCFCSRLPREREDGFGFECKGRGTRAQEPHCVAVGRVFAPSPQVAYFQAGHALLCLATIITRVLFCLYPSKISLSLSSCLGAVLVLWLFRGLPKALRCISLVSHTTG